MPDLSDQQTVLKVMSDVLGDEGMKVLFAKKNGTEIWIPATAKPDHWMSLLFGQGKAEEICRRLRVLNADGRLVCGMRCYVSNGLTRFQQFQMRLNQDICEALLAGKTVRKVCAETGSTERKVRKEFAHLREAGLIALPSKETDTPASQHQTRRSSSYVRKRDLVDEALLAGFSISEAAEYASSSIGLAQSREVNLIEQGKLPLGSPNGAARERDAIRLDDHSANIGEMVATPSDEVP